MRAAERRLDLGELDAARLQHNEQMVEQVGGLGDQVLAILGHGRERGLHRLLAELLGAMRHALVDQLAGIGLRPARAAARSCTRASRSCSVKTHGVAIA